MSQVGPHVTYTRLSLNTLNALGETKRWERKIAGSCRTRKQSKAQVHLASMPINQGKNIQAYTPPKLVKTARALLLMYEAYEQAGYQHLTMKPARPDHLLCQGLIAEDPRSPESGKYLITKAGKDYCAWLRSKKN